MIKGHENNIIFEGLLPAGLGALIPENPALGHPSWAASGRFQDTQADKCASQIAEAFIFLERARFLGEGGGAGESSVVRT